MQPFTFKRTKKRAHTLPTRTCTSIRTCTYAHLHEHAHAHVQAHAPARTSAHARACTSAHAHEHVHMHTQHAHAQAHRAYDRIASLTLLGRFRRACGVTLSFVICLCTHKKRKQNKTISDFECIMMYTLIYMYVTIMHIFTKPVYKMRAQSFEETDVRITHKYKIIILQQRIIKMYYTY